MFEFRNKFKKKIRTDEKEKEGVRIEAETDQDGETETRDSIKGLGDGNRTRVSILQAAHIHLNSDMMLHTSARYRRESTSLPTHNNTTTRLITDRQHGQNTAHTQTHTQNTAKHDRERERQKAEGSEEKERAEFKTNIRRKRRGLLRSIDQLNYT